jgi:hypothetical protein
MTAHPLNKELKMTRYFCLKAAAVASLLLFGGMVDLHAQLSAPLVGMIGGVGSTRNQIQPVVGVMGASTVGAPIEFQGEVERADVAPSGGWALIQQRNRAPGLVTFTGVTPGAVQAISGVSANPVLVRFSPTGKSAVLRFGSGAIQVLTGLNGSPQVAYQTEFLDPAGVSALAVSDDGSMVAAVTGAGMVYVLGNSSAPVMAYAGSRSMGLAFLPNQEAAVLADGGRGTISLCRMSGGPSIQTVTNLSFSGKDVLVEASLDGAAAFLAVAGDTTAYRINLTSGASQTATLPVAATRLDRLRDGQSFVFSAEAGKPAWILTGNDSGLQTVFASNPGVPSPLIRRPAAKDNRHD